jgi:membrane protein implicated in regulation of membrane protease activity
LVALGGVCLALALRAAAPVALAWGGVTFAVVSLVVLWRYRRVLTEVELAPIM